VTNILSRLDEIRSVAFVETTTPEGVLFQATFLRGVIPDLIAALRQAQGERDELAAEGTRLRESLAAVRAQADEMIRVHDASEAEHAATVEVLATARRMIDSANYAAESEERLRRETEAKGADLLTERDRLREALREWAASEDALVAYAQAHPEEEWAPTEMFARFEAAEKALRALLPAETKDRPTRSTHNEE
jgi:hypothetical protein